MIVSIAGDQIRETLAACRTHLISVAAFSLAINLLYLASPLYMLQVYDRVVTSSSVTTLVMLTLALLLAFIALASLDALRGQILTRAGARIERLLGPAVIAAAVGQTKASGVRSQPLRDLDTFRNFIAGAGIQSILDLPWTPIYVVAIFLLHPALGFFAIGCCVLLALLALVNEWLIRSPLHAANEAGARSYSFTEMSLRNAEVLRAMGMVSGFIRRWSRDRNQMMERQVSAGDRATTLQSVIRFARLAMQSIILGMGAYLVIEREVSAGAIFAASLLLGRALQPVEQIVGSWRNVLAAHAAFTRVRSLLKSQGSAGSQLTLPRPAGAVAVENLIHLAGGRPTLRNVNFRLAAGEALGVIGPSSAGKSTLARHLVGALQPSNGVVRIDGADITLWPNEMFGRHIGYLPQDIELFADTVAANISRFQTGLDAEVVQAAKLAGVHDLILRLPNGYDTEVGEGGATLSGGYRQRIGLARAVFGDPSLVVLDEPSSNLDADGDLALASCIAHLKQQGVTVIIVSHRPTTLALVDKVMVLRDGVMEMFGERAEIVAKLTRTAMPAAMAAGPAEIAGQPS